MKSIVIIEDHPIMQEGLRSYFEKSDNWNVLGAASSLGEAKKLLASVSADLLLLDNQLKDGWGLDLIPWLKKQKRYSGKRPSEPFPVMAVYSSFEDYTHVNAARLLILK